MEFNFSRYIENRKAEKQVAKDREQSIESNGRSRIIASLIDKDKIDSYSDAMIKLIVKGGENIDFHYRNDFYRNDYAISAFDEKDKYSRNYRDCLGLVITGKDKTTGRQVSLLTHHSWFCLLEDEQIRKFKKKLSKSLDASIDNIDKNTLDAIIYGGMGTVSLSDYEAAVKAANGMVEDALGVTPTVLTGPNMVSGAETAVYLDTQNKRLYLVRQEQKTHTNNNYLAKDIESEREQWNRPITKE